MGRYGPGVSLMSFLVAAVSVILILTVLREAFEALLLPRRVTRAFRFNRIFFAFSWRPWKALARRLPAGKRRDSFLSLFGPMAIPVLFGVWALGLIVGFAGLYWAVASPLTVARDRMGAIDYLYFSGVTLLTLGYGDITPTGAAGRILAVVEAGLGFACLAVVISYLPVLYQAFSRREVTISLLDARAGSPPTASQFLTRLARTQSVEIVDGLLAEWERWSAELLESHLSFPVLSYYRSQHDNQSWLAALATILDTSAILIAGVERTSTYQARLTFAMARHAAVDLAQVFQTRPLRSEVDRLPPDQLRALRDRLAASGLELRAIDELEPRLLELREMYEPFLNALSLHFLLTLPSVVPDKTPVDNWQTSAWMRRTRGIGTLTGPQQADDHDD